LKEEALDRTMWRARFGRGFGPVVRQTTKWMNHKMYNFNVSKCLSRMSFSFTGACLCVCGGFDVSMDGWAILYGQKYIFLWVCWSALLFLGYRMNVESELLTFSIWKRFVIDVVVVCCLKGTV
jgi:hypothetical protein